MKIPLKIPKFKKKFYRSRAGVTLVELIVAITIIVIVFTSVVYAFANGYSSTVSNVNVDAASAESQGITDAVMEAVSIYQLSSSVTLSSTMSDSNTIANHIASDIYDSTGATYVDSSVFPDSDGDDMQFTIIEGQTATTTNTTDATKQDIEGCIVKSAVLSVDGFIITEAFVPY